MPFAQESAGPLVTPVFSGPEAKTPALVFGNGVEAVLARFAPAQDPGGVKLAGGTAAVGFAAFAAEQVEGALDHGLGTLQGADSQAHGGVEAPELLAELGGVVTQTVSLISLPIQI